MRAFVLPVLCLTVPAVVAAQTPIKSAWKCSVVEPVSTVPVTGQANHAYSVYQVNCTASSGEINGNVSKGHGIFVETLENGVTVRYDYTFSSKMNGKVATAASNMFKIVSGTGKAKCIKGSGACKGKGNPDASLELQCTGTHTKAM